MACRNSWIIEIACLFNRLSYASLLSGLRKTSPPFWGFETMFFGRQILFRVWKSGDFLRWTGHLKLGCDRHTHHHPPKKKGRDIPKMVAFKDLFPLFHVFLFNQGLVI